MKRPHEDPACHCPACEAYDNRGLDTHYSKVYGTWETWTGADLTVAARCFIGIDRDPGEPDDALRTRCTELLRNPPLVPRSDQ